jgi:hypothetical protein
MAFGWVSKYLKDILSIKLWFYESLNNVALPLNNSMLQTTLFHELAISIRPPPPLLFTFKGNWVSFLHQDLTYRKPIRIYMNFEWFCKI